MTDDREGDGPDGDDAYRTVAGSGHAAFEVQGSEFLGYVDAVESVAAAEAFVDRYREEYDDATHVVPAYRVRVDGRLREYAADDGEPSGSAGDPALNVLAGRDLENVVAVVVRYYGGTNLGIGGLVGAYGRAVKTALDDAGETTERPHDRVTVRVEYDDSGTVRGVLESEGLSFDAEYGEAVTFAVRVPVADADDLRDRLLSATGGRAEIE